MGFEPTFPNKSGIRPLYDRSGLRPQLCNPSWQFTRNSAGSPWVCVAKSHIESGDTGRGVYTVTATRGSGTPTVPRGCSRRSSFPSRVFGIPTACCASACVPREFCITNKRARSVSRTNDTTNAARSTQRTHNACELNAGGSDGMGGLVPLVPCT